MSLAFVALLSTVGCVSVQADASRPAPAVSARSGNSPTPHASPAATAPAAVHDSLARTEEGSERAREERRRKRADAAAPSRAQAPDLPPRSVPVHPRAPRRPGVPHRLPPKRTYDMRAVCATGQGIASAELVDLCRSTYGR
ncbi:hypothetical protein ACFVS9_23330 [Streptomyces sp. NPDC058008]|uniref:hypothetical protein n=1 Tax=Streptomyces sp. NPDC058008 TaxID=3346303 RepID=UPI0036E0657D